MITTQLRALCAAGALALAPAAFTLAQAQNANPAKPTMPSAGGSPTTPPTHPTESGNPTTTPPPQGSAKPSGDATKKPTSTAEQAKQTCKNLSGAQERADCMKKAESQGSGNASGSTGSPDSSTGKAKAGKS